SSTFAIGWRPSRRTAKSASSKPRSPTASAAARPANQSERRHERRGLCHRGLGDHGCRAHGVLLLDRVAHASGRTVESVWPVTSTRRRALAALSLCGVAIVAIVVLTVVLSENVEYFRTVSEAVASKRSDGDHRFRMAGKVVPGTVEETAKGVNFDITDGK